MNNASLETFFHEAAVKKQQGHQPPPQTSSRRSRFNGHSSCSRLFECLDEDESIFSNLIDDMSRGDGSTTSKPKSMILLPSNKKDTAAGGSSRRSRRTTTTATANDNEDEGRESVPSPTLSSSQHESATLRLVSSLRRSGGGNPRGATTNNRSMLGSYSSHEPRSINVNGSSVRSKHITTGGAITRTSGHGSRRGNVRSLIRRSGSMKDLMEATTDNTNGDDDDDDEADEFASDDCSMDDVDEFGGDEYDVTMDLDDHPQRKSRRSTNNTSKQIDNDGFPTDDCFLNSSFSSSGSGSSFHYEAREAERDELMARFRKGITKTNTEDSNNDLNCQSWHGQVGVGRRSNSSRRLVASAATSSGDDNHDQLTSNSSHSYWSGRLRRSGSNGSLNGLEKAVTAEGSTMNPKGGRTRPRLQSRSTSLRSLKGGGLDSSSHHNRRERVNGGGVVVASSSSSRRAMRRGGSQRSLVSAGQQGRKEGGGMRRRSSLGSLNGLANDEEKRDHRIPASSGHRKRSEMRRGGSLKKLDDGKSDGQPTRRTQTRTGMKRRGSLGSLNGLDDQAQIKNPSSRRSGMMPRSGSLRSLENVEGNEPKSARRRTDGMRRSGSLRSLNGFLEDGTKDNEPLSRRRGPELKRRSGSLRSLNGLENDSKHSHDDGNQGGSSMRKAVMRLSGSAGSLNGLHDEKDQADANRMIPILRHRRGSQRSLRNVNDGNGDDAACTKNRSMTTRRRGSLGSLNGLEDGKERDLHEEMEMERRKIGMRRSGSLGSLNGLDVSDEGTRRNGNRRVTGMYRGGSQRSLAGRLNDNRNCNRTRRNDFCRGGSLRSLNSLEDHDGNVDLDRSFHDIMSQANSARGNLRVMLSSGPTDAIRRQMLSRSGSLSSLNGLQDDDRPSSSARLCPLGIDGGLERASWHDPIKAKSKKKKSRSSTKRNTGNATGKSSVIKEQEQEKADDEADAQTVATVDTSGSNSPPMTITTTKDSKGQGNLSREELLSAFYGDACPSSYEWHPLPNGGTTGPQSKSQSQPVAAASETTVASERKTTRSERRHQRLQQRR